MASHSHMATLPRQTSTASPKNLSSNATPVAYGCSRAL